MKRQERAKFLSDNQEALEAEAKAQESERLKTAIDTGDVDTMRDVLSGVTD